MAASSFAPSTNMAVASRIGGGGGGGSDSGKLRSCCSTTLQNARGLASGGVREQRSSPLALLDRFVAEDGRVGGRARAHTANWLSKTSRQKLRRRQREACEHFLLSPSIRSLRPFDSALACNPKTYAQHVFCCCETRAATIFYLIECLKKAESTIVRKRRSFADRRCAWRQRGGERIRRRLAAAI